MDIEKMTLEELQVAVATEVMGWHWDEAWDCLIPPEQKAKPDEMWTDWELDPGGWFREPIKGTMVSGVSYNGDSSKIILPDYPSDIAAAMRVVEKMRESDDETKFKFQGYFVYHQIDHVIDITPKAIGIAARMAVEAE